jgi:hypothetical protein
MDCLSRVRPLKSYTGGRKNVGFDQNRNSTASFVNLQLNLNLFRVDFALNIDPAKNWPSTDLSDQENNFMVHLFNENVVYLTVQIYNWPSTDSSDQESNFMVHLFNENVVHLTVQIYTTSSKKY